MSQARPSTADNSPQPTRTMANCERSTKCSRVGSPQPHTLGSPTHVQDLSKLTAMERIKLEAKERKSFNDSHYRESSPQFAQQGGSHLASPQRARKQTEAKKMDDEWRKKDPVAPAMLGEVTKEKQTASWAKCKTPRMQYQYNWKSMPRAVPQTSIVNKAPGPGAYGNSTSFCKQPRWGKNGPARDQ